MYCNVCGDTKNIKYYYELRQTICPACKIDTPKKVGKVEFDRTYWAGKEDEVSNSIKREFYRDYLSSRFTMQQYIVATQQEHAAHAEEKIC